VLLLTNDDGINAPGLKILRRHLETVDSVLVAAPENEMSAVSHSVTLRKPINVRWIDDKTAAVSGTPTDCVLVAVRGFMKKNKPDVVVSGINLGPNLGNDVTYSGTVAAALEAAIHGIKAVAISLAGYEKVDFEPAAEFCTKLVSHLGSVELPAGTFLNVNVPDVEGDRIRGVRVTSLGRRVYRDDVREVCDPEGFACYTIGGDPVCEMEEGSDVEAIESNFISVTPISLSMTDMGFIDEIRKWEQIF
jgi:5'-nucleotidase